MTAAVTGEAALRRSGGLLGPNQILAFFERWLRVIPKPLTAADRAAGYWWELSMRQVKVSRTLVFDAPRRARALFEAVIRDNLDLGRPHEVELIFTGKVGGPGRRHKQRPTTGSRRGWSPTAWTSPSTCFGSIRASSST